MDEHKELVGRVTWADTGESITFRNAEMYLECIKEELECMATTGFRFETLTRDPAVRRAVEDILYDFIGEENPHEVEDHKGGDNT